MPEDLFPWDELEELEAVTKNQSVEASPASPASVQGLPVQKGLLPESGNGATIPAITETSVATEAEGQTATQETAENDSAPPEAPEEDATPQEAAKDDAVLEQAAQEDTLPQEAPKASSQNNGLATKGKGAAASPTAAELRSPAQDSVVPSTAPPVENKLVKSWRVMHSRVVQRGEPSTKGAIVNVSSRGDVVQGITEDRSGTKWLRLQVPSASGMAQTVWMLIDGAQLGFGQLLEECDEAPLQASTAFARGDWLEAGIIMRAVSGRGNGLITERLFESAETVLKDKPFFTRPKPKDIQNRPEFTKQWGEAFNKIREPLRFAGEGNEGYMVASGAMVRNAIGYAKAPADTKTMILDLHFPDLRSTHPIISVTRKVAQLCIKHLPECHHFSESELLRGMLAIEMNVFSGGRLFGKFSRVNHSCVPNIVYIGMAGRWLFRAYNSIDPGVELLHSYLGEELLLPTEIRQRHLWRSKCFECVCERCSVSVDPMRKIPCRWCASSGWRVLHNAGVHLRKHAHRNADSIDILLPGVELYSLGKVEGDWVYVSDKKGVRGWVLTHGRSLRPPIDEALCGQCSFALEPSIAEMKAYQASASSTIQPVQDLLSFFGQAYVDESEYESTMAQVQENLWLPYSLADFEFTGPFAMYENGTWRCEQCGREPPHKEDVLKKERWLGRLAERHFFNPEMTPEMGPAAKNRGGVGGLTLVKIVFVPFAMDLLTAVFGVLGPQHWATQWGQLLIADFLLARWNYSPWKTDKNIREVRIILVRILDRLWSWLESLGLAQDPSCFLWERVKIALEVYNSGAFKARESIPDPDDRETLEAVDRLQKRFISCKKQVDILPLRPLIIEGSLSFAG